MSYFTMARQFIAAARARGESPSRIAAFYGVPLWIVTTPSRDMGTLNARKIMRAEIARLQGVVQPEDKDRYKGKRAY